MVIGVDVSRANRKEKTGIEWYAYHCINALKQIADPHDRYLLYTDTPLRDELATLPDNFEERLLAWPPKKFWTQGRLSWEMFRHPPELLIIPSHVLPVVHSKKVLLTCHDLGFEYQPHLYPKAELAYHRWSMRFGIRHATHLIAVSRYTKTELIQRYHLPEEKISVIYHGVDPHIFFPKKEGETITDLAQRYRLPHGRPYVLFCGRLEKKKNLETLLVAWKRWKGENPTLPFFLLLIGRRGYGYEHLHSRIQELHLEEDVRELGWVSQDDLPIFMRHAWALTLPSFVEGFGLPVLEAMASGVPTIVSSLPALREIAQDSALFFSPKNWKELAHALDTLYREKNLYILLRERGLKRSREFSWGKTAQETHQLIQNIRAPSRR